MNDTVELCFQTHLVLYKTRAAIGGWRKET